MLMTFPSPSPGALCPQKDPHLSRSQEAGWAPGLALYSY